MKKHIKEIQFDSWSDFSKNFKKSIDKIDNYIYRGQYNSDWPLKSSFQRFYEKTTLTKTAPPLDTDLSEILLNSYTKHRKTINEHNISTDKMIEIAKGQHYGLPTELLDWSRTLNKAIFFAFCDEVIHPMNHDYVSIYALKIKEISTLVNNFNIKRLIIQRGEFKMFESDGLKLIEIEPSQINARITTQSGCFTHLSTQENRRDLETFFEDIYSFYSLKYPILLKFKISFFQNFIILFLKIFFLKKFLLIFVTLS